MAGTQKRARSHLGLNPRAALLSPRPDLELPSPHGCAPTPSPGPLLFSPRAPPPRQPANRPDKLVTSSPGTRGTSPLIPAKPALTAPAGCLCLSAGSSSPGWECCGYHAHLCPHRGWGSLPHQGDGVPGTPGSLSAGTRAGPPGDCSGAGGWPPSGYEHSSPPPRGAWHPWVSAKRPSRAP